MGFEPTASATRTQRSTKLSHSPWHSTMPQFGAGSSAFVVRSRIPISEGMEVALGRRMTLRQRQTCLFLVCAVVLLAAGYGWGEAYAYTRYYSPGSLLDRETLDLQFNTRLLRYADTHQPDRVRSRLCARLTEQVRYIDQVIASSGDQSVARSAAASLEQARAALKPPRPAGNLTASNAVPVPRRESLARQVPAPEAVAAAR